MENLLSQFFLAPTTKTGTVSNPKQSNSNSSVTGFDAFLVKATQPNRASNTSDTLFTDLSPEQIEALSTLYAQLQNYNQATEIQPQPLAINKNQLGTETIVTQMGGEQIVSQKFNAEQLNFLQQLTNLNQVKDNTSLSNTTPQQALADKIFQIIEGQSSAQNISVQATTTTSVENINVAPSPQSSTSLSAAIATVTEPKLKPDNTKAEYSATSNLISPKVDKGDIASASAKMVTNIQNPSTDISEGRRLNTSASLTPLGQDNSEHSSIFSQLFATTNSNTNQTTLQGHTPLILPSGRLVYDDQVLQQFSNQLRINTNDLQQKVNIRLNPAELGELKIDLTMKEGAVRVNVLAHSQQAQEILERNMPKLRNVLEKQGLSIEGITVTQATSDLSEFGQFQDQLTQDQSSARQQHQGSRSKTPSLASPRDDMEEILETTSTSDDSNSVNLVA